MIGCDRHSNPGGEQGPYRNIGNRDREKHLAAGASLTPHDLARPPLLRVRPIAGSSSFLWRSNSGRWARIEQGKKLIDHDPIAKAFIGFSSTRLGATECFGGFHAAAIGAL